MLTATTLLPPLGVRVSSWQRPRRPVPLRRFSAGTSLRHAAAGASAGVVRGHLRDGFGLARPTRVQRLAVPALLARRDALVRAATGSGKTLAYLVPAVLSGKRVIISTATRTLQEQIFLKDLPLLRDIDDPGETSIRGYWAGSTFRSGAWPGAAEGPARTRGAGKGRGRMARLGGQEAP